MSDQPPAATTTSRRVTPGCLMLSFGGLWLLVLGAWMIWKLFAQLNEIRTFADTTAKPVATAQPGAEQISALRARINEFGAATGRGEKASLRLSIDDLNTLLASEEQAKHMKQNAKVDSIGETVRLQVSLAINGVPFTGELLYLNGYADLLPEIHEEKGIQLLTKNLTVPGKVVSEGFLNLYKENNPLDSLLMDELRKSRDPAIMTILKKLTTVRLEPGFAVLEYAP
jgi:hypothetical protein